LIEKDPHFEAARAANEEDGLSLGGGNAITALYTFPHMLGMHSSALHPSRIPAKRNYHILARIRRPLTMALPNWANAANAGRPAAAVAEERTSSKNPSNIDWMEMLREEDQTDVVEEEQDYIALSETFDGVLLPIFPEENKGLFAEAHDDWFLEAEDELEKDDEEEEEENFNGRLAGKIGRTIPTNAYSNGQGNNIKRSFPSKKGKGRTDRTSNGSWSNNSTSGGSWGQAPVREESDSADDFSNEDGYRRRPTRKVKKAKNKSHQPTVVVKKETWSD